MHSTARDWMNVRMSELRTLIWDCPRVWRLFGEYMLPSLTEPLQQNIAHSGTVPGISYLSGDSP